MLENTMQDFLIGEIDALPPLPQTIVELQRVCSYENSSIKQVANVIEQDPFLTMDLIKSANSPLYGYHREINSILQAVSMFGISTAKGLAIASAIKAKFVIDLTPYKLEVSQFVDVSNIKNAFLCRWLQKDIQLLGILVPCALTMHIGMVIISNCLKLAHKQEEFMSKINASQFLEIEQEILGCDQFEVLGHLFEHWGFEQTMVQVMRHLNDPNPPQDLLCFIYPLRVLNTLITPYEIAKQAQIVEARNLVEQYHLDLQGFDTTLENMHLNLESKPNETNTDYSLIDE
ncbi:HDOD domain-containing protein [Helicobacter sp. MIT 05-5294]|uniref:HDOD domain-containing protein n=1 Tax=Helicobacter sp. MIT 05-5294 TaxID=1548150 RepID=UPI000AE82FBE|nr:HDOD domain-containing protein [Helicobacter sp. MIT 05-5294]